MGPMDVELIRVYTREPGGAVGDVTAQKGSNFEIVVDAEVGTAKMAGGGIFRIGVVVRNLTQSTTIFTDNTGPQNFGNPSWPPPPPATNLAKAFTFTFPATTVNVQNDGDICEVLAWLEEGGVGPTPSDVSFARSPMFIISS